MWTTNKALRIRRTLCLESYYMWLQCDKDCEINLDKLVVTCNVVINTPETASINCNNSKRSYWLITVVLLAIVCLILLTVISVQYYIKSRLTI